MAAWLPYILVALPYCLACLTRLKPCFFLHLPCYIEAHEAMGWATETITPDEVIVVSHSQPSSYF